MAGALLPHAHLQPVGKEGEQFVGLPQIGMGLHQERPAHLPALFRDQHFELHRELDVALAQLDDLLVERAQNGNRFPQALVARDRAEMMPQQHGERQPQFILDHDADDAEGGAAQCIGVLGAGRLLVNQPEADQGVELVGERRGDRHGIGRHQIIGALGPVMVLDGVGDGLVLVLRLGVIAAHQALQVGEFANHFGQQIGLAQSRGALGPGDVGADDGRKLGRK